MIHRKKIKLKSEREFSFYRYAKKVFAFSLFTDIASFADIAHHVLDHLFRNRACNVFDCFLQLINHCRKYGVVTEEIIKGIEVGAV